MRSRFFTVLRAAAAACVTDVRCIIRMDLYRKQAASHAKNGGGAGAAIPTYCAAVGLVLDAFCGLAS